MKCCQIVNECFIANFPEVVTVQGRIYKTDQYLVKI